MPTTVHSTVHCVHHLYICSMVVEGGGGSQQPRRLLSASKSPRKVELSDNDVLILTEAFSN
jgi:hypothetical protein